MTGASSGPVFTWPDVLTELVHGRELGTDMITWVMSALLDGEATQAQIGALLVGLRAKGETPAEIGTLVDVTLSRAALIDVPGITVDTCGTGGDRSGSVNISTMAAVVVAAAGARVVKHGNRASSSRAGSADMLEALGVAIDLPPALVPVCIEEVGIGFCLAPLFHPALRHVGGPRRELAIGTVFNVLGPLANPARPDAQVMGIADVAMAETVARVLAARGTSALVVHGDDGLDELTTATTSRIWETRGTRDGRAGEVIESVLDPRALDLAAPPPGALDGGDAAFNADIARRVLGAQRSLALDYVRDAVLLNAAAALVAVRVVSATGAMAPVVDRIAAALPVVREVLDNGSVADVLHRWIEVSVRLRG